MIVLDADKCGLSQLYQLKGRVGRSNRIAYCYLMYQKDKVLSEVSETIALENLSGAPDCFNNGIGLTILPPGGEKRFTARYRLDVSS